MCVLSLMSTQQYDYIVVGGGIGGCVVASRLIEKKPALRILLVEAGPVADDHPLVGAASNAFRVRNSELNWNYASVPQRHLDSRVCYNSAGKALGGGSVVNSGGWVRGDPPDYNAWGNLVGDWRWTYEGLRPFFRKTESFFTTETDHKEHGFDGPIHVQSVSSAGRVYPLRERVKELWSTIGITESVKSSSGVLPAQSLRENLESWHNGRRQTASTVYPLRGVDVMTDTLVKRVLFAADEDIPSAIGIELATSKCFYCGTEVIIATGAYRTPQLLCLSGVGPSALLAEYNIPIVLQQEQVGQNFHDHLAVNLFWKLNDNKSPLAAGAEGFNHPSHAKGLPIDYIVYQTLPTATILTALREDDPQTDETHPLISPPRSHLEYYFVYAGMSPSNPKVPLDGTHVMTGAVGYLPTSRGSIRIASSDINDHPVIDNNYYATNFDRCVLRAGLREQGKMMRETPQGRALISHEIVPAGCQALSSQISDEELDKRVRLCGNTIYHPAGTASMGSVVDTSLCVKGVNRLRIVDASVIPVPLASHYQATVYALAEQAVDMILESRADS